MTELGNTHEKRIAKNARMLTEEEINQIENNTDLGNAIREYSKNGYGIICLTNSERARFNPCGRFDMSDVFETAALHYNTQPDKIEAFRIANIPEQHLFIAAVKMVE